MKCHECGDVEEVMDRCPCGEGRICDSCLWEIQRKNGVFD